MESARRDQRVESPLIADLTASKKRVNLAASQSFQPIKTLSPTKPMINPHQNYFSKEYVDELQSFYQRERDAYRTKIYTLEGELDSTKNDLTARIDDLNRQLERTKYTQDYLEKVESQNKQYTDSIREKDHVTRTQQELIAELRANIEKSEDRIRILTRENQLLKEQVDNSMQSETRTQRHYQELIERMRIDNSHMIRTLQEKHEYDKQELRTEYETLIGTIREEYQTQKNELREQMRKLEQELSIHQKEFKTLKGMFEAKIDDLNQQVASHLSTIKERDEEVADLSEKLHFAESEIARLEKELSLTGKDLDLEKQIR